MNHSSMAATNSRLGWFGVVVTTLAIFLMSHLILYPQPTPEALLLALRVTSLTTALPLWLVCVARPIALISRELAQWVQAHRRYLWLTLTASHLIHLYQIGLYYQVGQQCPFLVWAITIPVWGVMVAIAAIEWLRSSWIDELYQGTANASGAWLYGIALGYVWWVFTLAFGLGAIDRHLPFYNMPAFLLFLSAAILQGIGWTRRHYRQV